MNRELLIESWLEADEDDRITVVELYEASLQAIDYIEELEERLSHLETTLDTVDAALGSWRVSDDSIHS